MHDSAIFASVQKSSKMENPPSVSNSTFTTTIPTASTPTNESDTFCKLILHKEITGTSIRIWDLMILVPNVLFLFFLILRFNRAKAKLRVTSSPIFSTFYGLVFVNSGMSVIRCIVAMTANIGICTGTITDKILWLLLRFFLLGTEMSVIIFGLAFGHLDSKTSIRRVLLVTSFIALAYSVTQGALEFSYPDENFCNNHDVGDQPILIFYHGGMLFWFISSLIFCIIYTVIFILPWTSLREKLALPSKRSFYWYALFLSLLNFTQAVGSVLVYYKFARGMCVVDVTTFIYYTCITPLVYRTFLSEFFSIAQSSILFSYKPHLDEANEDDTVSLPHQSCSSLKTDSDYIYQSDNWYDSTQFDQSAINPLYSLSPDSVNSDHTEGSIGRPNSPDAKLATPTSSEIPKEINKTDFQIKNSITSQANEIRYQGAGKSGQSKKNAVVL